jgi:hypothetical protein
MSFLELYIRAAPEIWLGSAESCAVCVNRYVRPVYVTGPASRVFYIEAVYHKNWISSLSGH